MVKNLPANERNARDMVSIPRAGRSPEQEMASHSSVLAWEISWTEEPGGLQSMGSQRVGHDLVTDHAYTKLPDLMFQRNHPKHIHVGSFSYSEGMTIN